jgi:hypothetical protein
MVRIKIPANVLEAFVNGCLKQAKSGAGSVETGFSDGINSGSMLEDYNGGQNRAMQTAMDGLRDLDPKFGLASYPEPKLAKEKDYLHGYVRGLVDSISVLTLEDTRHMIGIAMQRLGLN